MRKIVSMVLALCLALGCFAVSAFAEGGTNDLVLSNVTSPVLDPQRNQGMAAHYIIDTLFEGLYGYSESGIKMTGCVGVEQSEDGLTWTFKLREDAKWTDGKAVTADDYVFAFKRLVDPKAACPYAIDYGQFLLNGKAIANGEKDVSELGVAAIDDFTLEVKLENPCAYFDALLCYPTFYPLRAECIDDEDLNDQGKITGDWAWNVETVITNGPMKLTYCDEAQKIVTERNEYYWDAANVKTDSITWLLMDDLNTCLAQFKAGDVDMLWQYPSEETESLMNDGYFHDATALGTGFLLVNCVDGPTTDARVRRALSLCINREKLANVLLSGIKVPATTYIGSGFPGATADGDFKSGSEDLLYYDPDEAKALLEEAGYGEGGEDLVIEIPYPTTNPDYQIVFEYLQAEWEESLGATVVLSPMDGGAWGTARENCDFTVTVQNWYADYFDASNMLSIFVSDHSINQGRYSSEKFDSLYNASLAEVDNEKRVQLMHDAEKVLVEEEAGMIPLYHNKKTFIYDDNVLENVVMCADAYPFWTQIVKK